MMMALVLGFYDRCVRALGQGVSIDELMRLPIRERIGRFKYIRDEAAADEFRGIAAEMDAEITAARQKEGF